MTQPTDDGEPSPDVKLCECGCGQSAPLARKANNRLGYVKGQSMRFIQGHGRRGLVIAGTALAAGTCSEPDCNGPVRTRGLCAACYNKAYKRGNLQMTLFGTGGRPKNPPGKRERRPQTEAMYRAKLKHKYGITADDYNQLLGQQGGVCAICGRSAEDGHSAKKRMPKKRLSVDHDHSTGAVRGLLCSPCNTVLGLMRDDPALLTAAAGYLLRTPPLSSGHDSLGLPLTWQ